jgi:hypothetical protein
MIHNISINLPIQHELLKSDIQREMDNLKDTQDPIPNDSIEYLYVLSASNSFARTHDFANCTDFDDDYNRMQHAIQTAKKIAALRASVKLGELNTELLCCHGPKIVYNGSERQNHDLNDALEHSIPDYPKEKFIILGLPQNQINTKGQFLSLKQNLSLKNTSVGIVTHAYHYPRISRMLGEEDPLYPFAARVTKYVFLIDRQFFSPGVEKRVKDEIEKIPIYIAKGDLALYPAQDIHYRLEHKARWFDLSILTKNSLDLLKCVLNSLHSFFSPLTNRFLDDGDEEESHIS